MSKKSLPLLLPIVVLLIASLACSRLTGGTTSGFQATADAAFTQAAAGAQGSGALATANAAATALVATANAATSGNPGAATATPAGDQPTAAATSSGGGGGTTADGGPSDVPLIDAHNTVQVASANLISYITDADLATVVTFYKDAMPKNGWTLNAAGSVETASAATLSFSKAGRNAQVTIGTANGKTVVAITVA